MMSDFNYFWAVFNQTSFNSPHPYTKENCTEYFMNNIVCRATKGSRMGRIKTPDEWRIITPDFIAVVNYKDCDDVAFFKGELSDLIALHDKISLKVQV